MSEAGDASFVVGGGQAGALIRAMDWQRSPLGPARAWSQSLRTSVSICVGSRFPIALYWGPDFVMLYNDDLIPMVGLDKHPWAMGRPAFEVLPEIREVIGPLLQQVRDTGEAIWSEDTMLPLVRNAMQEEGYFTFTYSPIQDESGGVGGVFCAVLETTDKVIEGRRLRLLSALAEAAQARTPEDACARAAAQLATAANDVPFALIYLLDDDAARLAGAANLAADDPLANATSWPLREVVEHGARRVVARAAVLLPIERAGGGRPLGVAVLGLSPLLRDSASYDRFHGLVATSLSQAVSNAAAYQAERQRAESLAELDRAKTTFFSNVSHELRTPLTLMLAPIQDLQALPAGAAVDPATVDLLQRNAQRLLKLVNTLLEFSRIEAGRIDAAYEPVELAAVTAELASSFRAAVEGAGLAFVVDCAPLAEPIYVDRDMWEKIVLNLLSNAFKFTFAGSIAVRLRLDGPVAALEVADTGTGIAEPELPRLFERFHRIEGARSRSHEGSGIGLALVQELVRLHGGEVRVASELGRGTRVEVRIPRGASHLAAERIRAARELPAALPPDAYASEARRWSKTASVEPRTGSTPRERIVFADDNADMREYVGRLLGERWDVELASDGAEALAAIRRQPPELVVCDVMMPELDGFALIRALRADPALQATPVIVLSARAGEDESTKGLEAGANDYIAKPFSARELLVRVASALAAGRNVRALREREQLQRGNLYRHFMQAPFPICVFRGPDHVIELANPPILRAWGKQAEIIGQPLMAAIPELRDQPFLGYLDEVLRTGVAYEGRAVRTLMPIGVDGQLEEAFFHFVYAPLRDVTGAVEGVLVSAFEVTEQIRARAMADAARGRLEALFMQAPVPISILEGPEHRYTLANEPFLRLVGQPALVGTTVAESFPERVAQGVLDVLDRVYATGEPYRGVEVPRRLVRRAGGPVEDGLFNIVYEPFRDLEGRICGILTVVLDVTDAVLAQRTSEQARARAEAAAEAQRELLDFQERFVAVLGHDLRNPLAAIDMAAGMLGQQAARANDATAIRVLNRVRSSSRRMSRMVEQILDLSRSRLGGGIEIKPTRLDLASVMASVVEELRVAYPGRELQLRCPPTPGTWDRDRLEQVFSNLIGNAIHHGVDGTPVTIDVARDAGEVRIAIHNEGPPIPDELRATLFSPFRRGGRDSRTAKTAGLGLGLYISRELVIAHGGTIEARSSAVEGTTFLVTLPSHAMAATKAEAPAS